MINNIVHGMEFSSLYYKSTFVKLSFVNMSEWSFFTFLVSFHITLSYFVMIYSHRTILTSGFISFRDHRKQISL